MEAPEATGAPFRTVSEGTFPGKPVETRIYPVESLCVRTGAALRPPDAPQVLVVFVGEGLRLDEPAFVQPLPFFFARALRALPASATSPVAALRARSHGLMACHFGVAETSMNA